MNPIDDLIAIRNVWLDSLVPEDVLNIHRMSRVIAHAQFDCKEF